MKNEAFSGFHPVVNLAFFTAVLGMTMFIQQPVYLAVSLLSSCAYLLYLQGSKGMLRQLGYLLPILLLMAVMNPVFSHRGNTVLFLLPDGDPVTLESTCFGLAAAAMMGGSIVWFNCCNTVFTSDKTMYLFGRVVPSLSLLMSMTLRFVPRFKHYLQSVMQVQRAMHRPENTRQKLQQALAAFSATVSWAMEQSIVSSDSMKSRGYGTAERTAFSIYSFQKRDGAALVLLVLLWAGSAVPWMTDSVRWEFYPGFSGNLLAPVSLLAYVCYGGMCLLPLIIDLMEDHKWNSFRSKI